MVASKFGHWSRPYFGPQPILLGFPPLVGARAHVPHTLHLNRRVRIKVSCAVKGFELDARYRAGALCARPTTKRRKCAASVVRDGVIPGAR